MSSKPASNRHPLELLKKSAQALDREIQAAQTDASRSIEVTAGVLVCSGDEGYVYRFRSVVPILLQPETPISFKPRQSKVILQGTFIGATEFELLLILEERIDADAGKLFAEPLFIYDRLRQRLDTLAHDVSAVHPRIARVFVDNGGLSDSAAVGNHEQLRQQASQQFSGLSESQLQAIEKCCTQPVHFVWGPPQQLILAIATLSSLSPVRIRKS
jgi:hypothetical protein